MRKASLAAKAVEDRTIEIEVDLGIDVYDWDEEMLSFHISSGIFWETSDLDSAWLLPLWRRLRSDTCLLGSFTRRTLLGQLDSDGWPKGDDHRGFRPDETVPCFSAIAEQGFFAGYDSHRVAEALDTFTLSTVVKYHRATLRTPEEARTVELRDDFLSPTVLPCAASSVFHSAAQAAVVLRLPWIEATPSNAMEGAWLRLREAVRSTPKVLPQLQTMMALYQAYSCCGEDDGVFSRIADRLSPLYGHDDAWSEYRLFLPAIERLSLQDQQLYINQMTGQNTGQDEASFGSAAAFVYEMFDELHMEPAMIRFAIPD